jgi:hypothetical protein
VSTLGSRSAGLEYVQDDQDLACAMPLSLVYANRHNLSTRVRVVMDGNRPNAGARFDLQVPVAAQHSVRTHVVALANIQSIVAQ